MHHQSSRGFHGLVQLLTFMCRFFPDLDGRDTARYVMFGLKLNLCAFELLTSVLLYA